jgi:hypothetical protein
MKRGEITPGMDVYVCENWYWERRRETPDNCRWTVVTEEVIDPFTKEPTGKVTPFFRFGNSHRSAWVAEWVADPKGPRVKIRQPVKHSAHPRIEYVPLARLRGEYDTVRAERAEMIEKRKAEQQQEENRRNAAQDARDAVVTDAVTLGFEVGRNGFTAVHVPTATLRAMLDEIARLRAAVELYRADRMNEA